jgi:hypothetical protein
MKEMTAHDIVAFAIVELNVPVALEDLYKMSPTDPLYKSLINAWKEKERREDFRTALLCAVIANCMGGGKKKYEPKDFMPQEAKSTTEKENDIKSQFIKYMAASSTK